MRSTAPLAARLAKHAAEVAGMASLAIGLALLVDPGRASSLLALPPGRRRARTLGCIDLLLACGLLFGRRRRGWMLARAAFNAALAVDYRQTSPGLRTDLRRGASHALTALTIIDGAAALALR